MQWILGLVFAAGLWVWDERTTTAAEKATLRGEIASLRAAVDQRPDLIERRNREQDKMEACMQRQLDLALRCGCVRAGGDGRQ